MEAPHPKSAAGPHVVAASSPTTVASRSAEPSSSLTFVPVLLCCGLAAGLSGLLLHPDVPQLHRTLRGLLPANWTYFDLACRFGYLAHSVAYLTISFVVVRLTRKLSLRTRRAIVVALFLHGVVSESAQLFVAGRDFDVVDMLCNATATALGVSLSWVRRSKAVDGEEETSVLDVPIRTAA